MPNGVRHTVGALFGVAALPLLYYGLTHSSDRLAVQAQTTVGRTPAAVWIAGMVATGLLVGVLAVWQRLSPMAPLVSGLPLLGVGVLWMIAPSLGLRLLTTLNFVSPPAGGTAGYTGLYLLTGLVLFCAVLSPARWRGRASRHTPAHAATSTPQPTERPSAWQSEQQAPQPWQGGPGQQNDPWQQNTPQTRAAWQGSPVGPQNAQPQGSGSLFQPPPGQSSQPPPPLPRRRPSSSA